MAAAASVAASAAANGGEFIYSLATREKVQEQVFSVYCELEERHCCSCRCPEWQAESKAIAAEFAKEALRFTKDAAKANLIVFGRFGQDVIGDYGLAIIKDSEHYSDVKETAEHFEFTFDSDSPRPQACPNLRYCIEQSGACFGGGKVRLRLQKDQNVRFAISRIFEDGKESQRIIEQDRRQPNLQKLSD